MPVSREPGSKERVMSRQKCVHSPLQPLPKPLPSPTRRRLQGKDLWPKQCPDEIWAEKLKHRVYPPISVFKEQGSSEIKPKGNVHLQLFCFIALGTHKKAIQAEAAFSQSTLGSDWALPSSELFCSWRQREREKQELIMGRGETRKVLADLNKGEFSA